MSTNFQFYETIQVIENIEIRKYDEQIIASHVSKDNSNNNFSILANYIFGNNSKLRLIKFFLPIKILSLSFLTISTPTPKIFILLNNSLKFFNYIV